MAELMIVVAVIGILGAVALPRFKNYWMLAKAAETTLVLATLQKDNDAHFAEEGYYTTNLEKLWGNSPPADAARCVYGFAVGDSTGEAYCPSGDVEDCFSTYDETDEKLLNGVTSADLQTPAYLACTKNGADCTYLRDTYNPRRGLPPVAADFTAGKPTGSFPMAVCNLDSDEYLSKYIVAGRSRVIVPVCDDRSNDIAAQFEGDGGVALGDCELDGGDDFDF